MVWSKWVALLSLFTFLISTRPVHAAAVRQDNPWLEWKTQYFSILYHLESHEFVDRRIVHYVNQLDTEYQRLSNLFDAELLTPVTIRLYLTTDEYYQLNPLPLEVNETASHSHVGQREIALFQDHIANSYLRWDSEAINVLRYELAILFILKTTDQKAPEGFLAGTATYLQDPAWLFNQPYANSVNRLFPQQTWREIWSEQGFLTDPSSALGASTIVAFLVDTYGWLQFSDFIKAIPNSETIYKALSNTYGVDLATLENQQIYYYRSYMTGQWKKHPLYYYNLSQAHSLVEMGAYGDALQVLNADKVIVDLSKQEEKSKEVESLIAAANDGQLAGSTLMQARFALQSGNYDETLRLVEQSRDLYAKLKNQSHAVELYEYELRATNILALREDLNKIRADLNQEVDNSAIISRLVDIGTRFKELGDRKDSAEVNILLDGIYAHKVSQQEDARKNLLYILATLIVIRILLILYRPPKEATLV